MFHQPWIIVLCYLNIFPGACQTAFDKGYCNLPHSSSIKCCTGFYLSENKCKECEPGYVGKNCSSTCQIGYFGLQCKELCNCSPDKYCDPTRGCVCNTTSVNCIDTAAADSIRNLLAVPILIPAIACLVFGLICIRLRNSHIMKRKKDIFSMQNIADFTVKSKRLETEDQNPYDEIYDYVNLRVQHFDHSIYNTNSTADAGDSASSFGLTTAVPLQQSQSVESIQIELRLNVNGFGESIVDEPHVKIVDNKTTDRQADIYSTPCKRMAKKGQRNGNETVTFKYPNSIIDTFVHEPESRTKVISPLKWTQDEEIFANAGDVANTNNSLRPVSPLERVESEEYCDVSYLGQLKSDKCDHLLP